MTTDAGSLKRGVALLRLLATAGARGLALTELATRASMPHSTVHRVLAQLIDERLATQHDESRRYTLGPLAFELGLAGAMQFDIRDLCDDAMARLAEASEDTVYLIIRSGDEAVCLHRREGAFPIRTLTLEVDSRRPLGQGAGGLAILAALPDEERLPIIDRIAPRLASEARMSRDDLDSAVRETHAQGLALIHNRVTLGVSAVGIHFRDSMGRTVGSVSVAALHDRMGAQRIRKLGPLLKAAAAEIERNLYEGRRRGTPRARTPGSGGALLR